MSRWDNQEFRIFLVNILRYSIRSDSFFRFYVFYCDLHIVSSDATNGDRSMVLIVYITVRERKTRYIIEYCLKVIGKRIGYFLWFG